MPLPSPVERERFHTRSLDIQGYRRGDGLWDIEAHLIDSKSYAFPNEHRGEIGAGEPLHDMWLRLTIDEDLVVRDVAAATDAAPYGVCPEVTPNFKAMIGAQIGPGWRREIKTRVGGVAGCTHLAETLGAMATVAYQTLYPVLIRKQKTAAEAGSPALLDSCHAYRSDGEIARRLWPDHARPSSPTARKARGAKP
jgi:hypothetical protein